MPSQNIAARGLYPSEHDPPSLFLTIIPTKNPASTPAPRLQLGASQPSDLEVFPKNASRFCRACAALVAGVLSLLAGPSLPALPPPPLNILQNLTAGSLGYIFLSPTGPASGAYAIGPEILDTSGHIVWSLPLPAGGLATDLRVQTYNGQPVLTWTQGIGFQNMVAGATTDYICDPTYTVIATVQAGNGLNADQHEFRLTPQNTALITIYHNAPADLSSVGGPVDGIVQEGVMQEIDVATGAVLLEWHSIDHVALTESYEPLPASGPYDYFHINSVSLDTDGNLLISSRHTWTVYKVNRTTGAVIWRLGGKKSDFALGAGLPFAWQHDVEAVDATTLRIFDNESGGVPVLPASRVIWVTHDDVAMTASLARSLQHPSGLSVFAEGNAQALSNGDTFVDWGIVGRVSEFDSNGALVFDAPLAKGYSSYRGYRMPWTGLPSTLPVASAQYNADGTTTVDAIWNGATQVATWQVMAGNSAAALSPVGTTPWAGRDTALSVPGQADYVEVVGLDSTGAVVATSNPLAVAPTFTTQPVSQTVASGATAVFSAAAAAPAATYQWSFNGTALADGPFAGGIVSGSSGPTLVLNAAAPGNAGAYTCTATDAVASSTSAPATLAVSGTSDVGRLINISCRAAVGTGDNVLIAGFVLGGPQAAGTDSLLLRASGPALVPFGVSNALADPELIFNGSGLPSIFTAGWGASAGIAALAAQVGAFAWADAPSLDQATSATQLTGAYTAEVAGQSGDSGVALVEVYDLTPESSYTPSQPHLLNVSARASVGTGANVLIAGFVIGGTTSKTVLIRAAGPALTPLGVQGALGDPVLQLYGSASATAPLASNSGWNADPLLSAVANAAGAFSFGNTATHDSVLLLTLPPGSYTAQVQGQSGDSGVALVEVYEVP